jgi:hypothetical protein
MTMLLLFRQKQKTPAKQNIYTDKYLKLLEERKAIRSVLPYIPDFDLYDVYQTKLESLDEEICLYLKKAREANERNDNIYAIAEVIKQY